MKIFTWTKRLVLTLSFLALIATNVLTLTHTAFNAALSGLLSTKLGMQTVSGKLDRQLKAKSKIIKKQSATLAKRKIATKKFGKRLASRTKRVAAASMAGVSGKSIPLIGTTLLIAGTGYELYLACENMRDLDELYSDMGMTDEVPDDVLHSVCNPGFLGTEKRPLGDKCFHDGQCDSDECKKNKCVLNEFLNLDKLKTDQ